MFPTYLYGGHYLLMILTINSRLTDRRSYRVGEHAVLSCCACKSIRLKSHVSTSWFTLRFGDPPPPYECLHKRLLEHDIYDTVLTATDI